MILQYLAWAAALGAAVVLLRKLTIRLQLSRAKHPSIAGHARMSKRLARLVPFYEYEPVAAFRSDGADDALAEKRRQAFDRLAGKLSCGSPHTLQASRELEPYVADMQFTNAYRVPFQYRRLVQEKFQPASMVEASEGVRLKNLDGNWSYDLGGSYGVNLLGYDFYKGCMERAAERVRDLGPVLGPYHPIISDNVRMLREVSGLDQVSFHMSGTEAVMQAVALARYHTGKNASGPVHRRLSRLVGRRAGRALGNQRKVNDVYTLKDLSDRYLARCSGPARISPVCWSTRCRPCTRTAARPVTRC